MNFVLLLQPAYQNLRQRVESSVSRYLSKQGGNWKPTNNKSQLRNQLRKHIQESNYLEAGVEGIVDQVVGPKILPIIQPEVESIIYKMFGVEKPVQTEEPEEDMVDNAAELMMPGLYNNHHTRIGYGK